MSHWFYITPEEYEQAAKIGVDSESLSRRVRLLGWKKDRAINTPLGKITDRSEWTAIAKQNGIGYNTFMNRVNNHGWSEERAATEPLQDRRAAAALATEKIRIIPREYIDLASQNGIAYHTLRMRLKKGWSPEKATTAPVLTNSESGKRGAKALRDREGDWAAVIFKKKESDTIKDKEVRL